MKYEGEGWRKSFLRECWSFTWSFDTAAAVVALVASAAAEAAEAVVQ